MSQAKSRSTADWEAIERDYRAGVKSLREMAAEHGISHPAIRKRAERDGWTRDLKAKVAAKASALVSAAQVTAEVPAETKITEAVTVDVEAKVQARIRIAHRADIGRSRNLLAKLLLELEQQTDGQGTFEQLLEALATEDGGDEKAAADRRKRLWEQWQKAMSLGGRADTMKKLADTLRVLIDKEREAYGIDSAGEPQDGGVRRSLTDAEMAVRLGRLLKTRPEVAGAVPWLAEHQTPRAVQ